MSETSNEQSSSSNQINPWAARRRIWLVDTVGEGVAFAMMDFINMFRSNRPGQSDRKPEEDAPKHAALDQESGGTYETAAGNYPAPPGVHEAPHSQWPIVIAAAIAFTFFGLITSYAFCLFGVVVFVVGIVGWSAELLSE